jgi:hypothetical protein
MTFILSLYFAVHRIDFLAGWVCQYEQCGLSQEVSGMSDGEMLPVKTGLLRRRRCRLMLTK